MSRVRVKLDFVVEWKGPGLPTGTYWLDALSADNFSYIPGVTTIEPGMRCQVSMLDFPRSGRPKKGAKP